MVVTIGIAALNSGFFRNMAGSVTTAPTASLPLVLMAAFLVPLFMLHRPALLQARQNAVGSE